MSWSTAVVLIIVMITTMNRLDRLEAAANLIPGRRTDD